MFNGFKRCGDANILSVYKYTQEKQIYENIYNDLNVVQTVEFF